MGLTVKEIENLKPGSKPQKLADGGGLCLLVSPTGAKLWRWRYRFEGTEKMMALGEFPLVTLKEARERHAAARKVLAGGIDPMAERKAEVESRRREAEKRERLAANSFENIARKWWEWWAAGKSPRHADYVLRRLEADVFPAFGHKFIDNVTPADIRSLMLAIEGRNAGQSNSIRGFLDARTHQARHLHEVLRESFGNRGLHSADAHRPPPERRSS